jgi:O-antigen/teichoic acid export membrane protein
MPLRAYPGLLLAQERFHWVPLVQSFVPWIQIAIFWSLLHAHYGVRAYPWAFGISQGCAWLVWIWQVHGKGFRIQIDFGGWTRSRFRELFSYSGSLALSGIIGSVVQSLPSMLLARFGGLSLVPVYNLTNRGPAMMDSLCNRTAHAFYPNLQKLYVTDERERFRNKFREVNQLAVWVSLIGAGGILAGNRSLICWLAKTDFYAGHWTNVWFACALLIVPFVNGLINLLQYSGSMGKIAVFSLLELPVGALICWFGFRYAGLSGLACGFALLPMMVRAPYALVRGARNCGFKPWDICGNAITALAISFALVLAGGWWISRQSMAVTPIEIFGRMTSLPTWREVLVGLLAGLAGTAMAVRNLRAIRSY